MIEGEIKSITEFGFFIGIDNEIDGMVPHLSDLSCRRWRRMAIKTYEKGQTVKAKGAGHRRREGARLPRHQAAWTRVRRAEKASGAASGGPASRKGNVVTGTITEVNDGGVEVELHAACAPSSAAPTRVRDRNDQRPERFGKGNKVDALVTSVDKATRKVSLSIKAKEVAEEKEAFSQYGSSDLWSTAGDILWRGPEEEDQERRKGRIVSSLRNHGKRRGVSRAFFVCPLCPTVRQNNLERHTMKSLLFTSLTLATLILPAIAQNQTQNPGRAKSCMSPRRT